MNVNDRINLIKTVYDACADNASVFADYAGKVKSIFNIFVNKGFSNEEALTLTIKTMDDISHIIEQAGGNQ